MSVIPGFLTPAETAERLGLSTDQVYADLAADRFVGAVRPGGRDWLIPERSVARFRRRPRGNPNFVRAKDLA